MHEYAPQVCQAFCSFLAVFLFFSTKCVHEFFSFKTDENPMCKCLHFKNVFVGKWPCNRCFTVYLQFLTSCPRSVHDSKSKPLGKVKGVYTYLRKFEVTCILSYMTIAYSNNLATSQLLYSI